MPSTYTPASVELGSITIPSDGDSPIKAADVNGPLEALGDGVAFLAGHLKLVADVITSSGTWTAPAGCDAVILIGCGGGGGGGGGGRGTNPANTANSYNCSGSAGGGAPLGVVSVAVTPTTGYTVTIGTAGAAGTADTGTGAGNGGAGGDTSFGTLAYFPGGGGGRGGNVMGDATHYALVAGGTIKGWNALPTTLGQAAGNILVLTTETLWPMSAPGNGGFGTTNHSALWSGTGMQNGQPNNFGGFAPGSVGAARGTDSGTLRGGGAGAGGGAGPFGVGADGGNGGNANGAGGGVSGGDGNAAGANTGAGGGGGGAAGMGTAAVGNGGAGGAGGTGKLIVLRVAKG